MSCSDSNVSEDFEASLKEETSSNNTSSNTNQTITNVNANGATFTSIGGNLSLEFTTRGGWSITKQETATWLTISNSSGNSDGQVVITVSATDNPSISKRTGTLFIKPDNGSTTYEVTFTQNGRFLTLSPSDDITMFAKGGSTSPISVTTDGTWTVESSVSWINVRKSDSSFTIEVDKMTTGTDRSGIVTVELTGLIDSNRYIKTISVKQMNKGDLYTDGETSGNPAGGSEINVDRTEHDSEVDWNGQLSGTK